MNPRAASALARFGAKPPSSPTLVLWPAALSWARRAWNTSAPTRAASAKLAAASGRIMNSRMAIGLSAWPPPLLLFILGPGAAEGAALQPDIVLDGRIAPAVENLAASDIDDRGHAASLRFNAARSARPWPGGRAPSGFRAAPASASAAPCWGRRRAPCRDPG